jgi:hypothetical protein
MAALISTSSYGNPYSDFLSIRKDREAFGPMKRFKKEVRLPAPNEPGTADPLGPMRRFSRNISPPRYTPIDPSERGPLSSSLSRDWMTRPFSNDWLIADRAYRSASSFTSSGSTVNSYR